MNKGSLTLLFSVNVRTVALPPLVISSVNEFINGRNDSRGGEARDEGFFRV